MSCVEMKRVTLTPEMARALLTTAADSGFKNRGVTRASVKRLSAEMSAGRWVDDASTICVGPRGMFDGQHRCLAVVDSGVPVRVWMAVYDSEDAYLVIDTGRSRDRGDALSSFTPAYRQMAAIVSAVFAIERRAMNLANNTVALYGRGTNAETVARYLADKEAFDRAAHVGQTVFRGVGTGGSSASGIAWFVYRDTAWIDSFVDSVSTGEGLHKGHAALALRNRILLDGTMRPPPSTPTRIAVWMSALRAHEQGRPLHKIMVRDFIYPNRPTLKYVSKEAA